MWEEIISMAMNNGLWAVLFCLLFLYEIKDSRKREHKYQDVIEKLTDSMEIVRDIREDCDEIKIKLCAQTSIKNTANSRKKPQKTANMTVEMASAEVAI